MSAPQSSVLALLHRYGIRPKKALGQHFLTSDGIGRRIVEAAGVDADTVVLEIGSGTGALTRRLVERARHVVGVEIDAALYRALLSEFADCRNLTLHHQDVRSLDIAEVCRTHRVDDLVVVGNLPYHITGAVIERLLTHRPVIRRATIMVQEEVGDRLMAPPGGKTYGALSVIVQYVYHPRLLFRVAPGNFIPRPGVRSIVMTLTPHPAPPITVRDPDLFVRLVKAAFRHRRKMLHHALTGGLFPGIDAARLPDIARQAGIDLRRRGETLSLAEFGRLADVVWSLQKTGVCDTVVHAR